MRGGRRMVPFADLGVAAIALAKMAHLERCAGHQHVDLDPRTSALGGGIRRRTGSEWPMSSRRSDI